MTERVEILAPAGNMENLVAAVYSGANAVYLGVQSFNARASAANFTFEQLKEAVEFCHGRNVKVNVTLNTILYDRELKDFAETVKQVAMCGVDAVIVQDLAAARIIKDIVPSLPLHASTQMAVHNLSGALLLKEMGYSRVILSRELTLEQIEHITKNCGIETEIFVHGALCMSLSGQCYASAFLGGRSGNRGRCAGTCRLPMSASGKKDEYHLSLKDMCAMDLLPEIEAIGVKCVKIEGRLRTPEYVAAAVDSAVKARDGKSYDRQLLQDAFSRSGFTDAFLQGRLDKNVFGVRTAQDSRKTKRALPKLRELYRRERQCVPVDFSFDMGMDKSILRVSDGKNRFEREIDVTPQPAEKDFKERLKIALAKLGGTPFYMRNADCNVMEGMYIPLPEINKAKKELARQLLKARERINVYDIYDYDIPSFEQRRTEPELIARFENVAQRPKEKLDCFRYIVFPLNQAQQIDERLKENTILELSRDIFGKENRLKQQVEKAKSLGFKRFCVGNIGHIPLVEGCEIFSSFTLNISNSLAALEYQKLGVDVMTISPEITLEQAGRITSVVKKAVIGYGHLPLMMVKACPMHNVRTCADCDGKGFLTDRLGKKFPLVCHGKINGYREIFNPVPLYIGDRKEDISADYITLNFTVESRDKAAEVIDTFLSAKPFDKEFTRGLYYKASI